MKKDLLRRALPVVIAIVLGVSIYRWNARSLLNNELPMPFGYGTAIVLSGSMEPTLNVDDLAVVRQTDTIQADDIVIYHDGRDLVIHRVIAVEGDEILTKGDANNMADVPITMDDIKGTLVLTIPHAGPVVRFLRRPAVVVIVLAAGVVLMELSFRKEKEKDQQELDEIKDEIRRLMDEIKNDTE